MENQIDTTVASSAFSGMVSTFQDYLAVALPYLIPLLATVLTGVLLWYSWRLAVRGFNMK